MLGLRLLSQGGSQVPQPECLGSGLFSVGTAISHVFDTVSGHKTPPKHSGTGDVMFSPAPNHFWPRTHFLFCNEMAQECHSSDTSEAGRERGPRRKSSCSMCVWDSDTDLFEQWWLDSHVSKSLVSTYYTLIHIFRPHSLTFFDLSSWNASGDRGVQRTTFSHIEVATDFRTLDLK